MTSLMNMTTNGLAGKRAMVAGAGIRPPRPGIGRAAAIGLGQSGAQVACIDLDQDRAEATAADVRATGAKAIAIAADLRDAAAAQGAVQQVVAEFGGLDVCIDIIGEARWNPFLEFTEQDWDWTMGTNLRQLYLVCQAAARQMAKQGTGGSIACVASVDGLAASPYHSAYGSAKAGVVSLVKTMAEELGPLNIRANAVAPGAVWSPTAAEPNVPVSDQYTALRRPEAEDIAAGLLFLSSDLARSITGQTLAVDGGASTSSAFPNTYKANFERLRAQ